MSSINPIFYQARRPTKKQAKLAEIFINNLGTNGMTKGEMLEKAGYSDTTSPGSYLSSEGFKTALKEQMLLEGITERKISKRLKWLLEGAGENNHVATINALKEIFKITGAYAPTKTENKTDINITNTIEDKSADYMEFLQQKNKQREVIDGEIIDIDTN